VFKLKPYYFVITAMIVMMFWQQCSHINEIKSERSSSISAVDFLKRENTALIQTKNLQAEAMVDMNQSIVTEKTARDILQKDFEEFKSIQSQVKAELLTAIRSVELDYEPPSFEGIFDGIAFQSRNCINKDTVDKYFLRIPRKIVIDTSQWMEFYATIGKEFVLDSMKIVNKIDATLGFKKPEKKFKFLRRAEPVLAFNSYNPYSSVPYVNNLVVEEVGTKFGKILNSRAAWFMYGFGANTLINKNTSNGSN